MELIQINKKIHVTVARGTAIKLGVFFVAVFGFGVGMGVSLVVSDVIREALESIQNNKAMVRSAAQMAVDNEHELQTMRTRCNL